VNAASPPIADASPATLNGTISVYCAESPSTIEYSLVGPGPLAWPPNPGTNWPLAYFGWT
jgi:hypothetical protein